MSDNQNPSTEENLEVTPEIETPENPEAGSPPPPEGSQDRAPRWDRGNGANGRGPRPDRGNGSGGRGPRRDRMQEEEKEFREELLAIDRVTRVTAGGRQIRFRASIVIGDGKGRIGLGTGKAGEVQMAIEKAIRDAKKNLITFPIVNGTIPHDVSVNYKSSSLYIHPAHPGTGIIAWGAVRKIFSVSGVRDIIAKQHGAPNMITNARVTLKALENLKPAHLTPSFASKGVSSPASEEVTPLPKKQDEGAVAKKAEPKKSGEEKKTPTKEKAPAKEEAPAKKPSPKKKAE